MLAQQKTKKYPFEGQIEIVVSLNQCFKGRLVCILDALMAFADRQNAVEPIKYISA